ncbi:FtsX-like permease family protein [Ekhidna sp.]|uniref:FtsX-like permease family protein n=1 Tax=Ekhidna sp. TaxID=2608089 RepID=UPI003CCBC845
MKHRKVKPPGWIQRLVERYCEPYLFEGISGDLEELFFENVEQKGPAKARIIYLLQALGFFRMGFKKRSKRVSNMKAIWTNYLLTSFRSLKRQKAPLFINLLGLVLAITCSLYAMIFIHDESKFDDHIKENKSIYRLYKHHINVSEGVDHFTYETSGMMGPTMYDEYPEITNYVRVLPWWNEEVLSYEKTNIATPYLFFADSNFFKFFDIEIVQGDPNEILRAPSSIALSEPLAKSLFGDSSPIGKKLIGLGDLPYTVTGIFKAPPRRSSLQYHAVISWKTTIPAVGPLSFNWMNNWLAQGISTFVKIAPETNPELLADKLPEMMRRHFAERADHYFLKFMPLDEMYLTNKEIRPAGSAKTKRGNYTFILTLGLSAILILVIASVNYINMMLSRATQTQTEVGIRKVMGSSRPQLVARFISETLITTLFASVISIIILALLLPFLNELTGKSLNVEIIFQPLTLISLIAFILGVSLIVGLYPSTVLSAPPISSILQKSAQMGSIGWFRKSLLAVQYMISIFLLICTIVVMKQNHYLKNRPLGFTKEKVLVVELNNEMSDKGAVFEEELRKHPNILQVSTSRSAIGAGSYSTTVIPEGYTDELGTRIYEVDQEFFETYEIETKFGRTFRKGSMADSMNIIVNEAMVEFMGWNDPIGKHIRMTPEGHPFPIIGVVKDFHIFSLATSKIEPMILFFNPVSHQNTSIKIGDGDVMNTINHIQTSWDKLADRTPLSFYFLDSWYNDLYLKETKLLKMASIYAVISIILCGLGLFGLTSLALQQRKKELSIRKVLGASVGSLIKLVNSQFSGIILISFVIAAPISYYLVSEWLENFEYGITVDAFAFILAGGFTFIISGLIISGLSLKTANTNPSKTLSNE